MCIRDSLRPTAQQHHPNSGSSKANLCGKVASGLGVDVWADNDQHLALLGGQGAGDQLRRLDLLHLVPDCESVGPQCRRIGIPQDGHQMSQAMRRRLLFWSRAVLMSTSVRRATSVRSTGTQVSRPTVLVMMWWVCLLYTSPSPRDRTRSRMP